MMPHTLSLAFGLSFNDLYCRDGLSKIHQHFDAYLYEYDEGLCLRWRDALNDPSALTEKEENTLLIDVAPLLESFIAQLFGIMSFVLALKQSYSDISVIPFIKRQFVQRFALKKYPNPAEIAPSPMFTFESELDFAKKIAAWLVHESDYEAELDQAARFAAFATLTDAGRKQFPHSVLFAVPQKLDFSALVRHVHQDDRGMFYDILRSRQGFDVTDTGVSRTVAIDQAQYCIHCHHQGKDSCSKGLKNRTPSLDSAASIYQKNALNVDLIGCPLEEKISEMNQLKGQGVPLGALSVAMVDNPLLAATGYRICNDCAKACIFQKQQPVDIPAIETQTLSDILDLPWGFEIYSLLSRWNPLNIRRPLPKHDTHKRVLVVGMGPAGFNLAHHLLNDGHTVIGIDGLKIEPLPTVQNGVHPTGEKAVFLPIRDWHVLKEPLSTRITGGFGGVAEYGITVRWDKNNLKLIRLLLERRQNFLLKGGVRFGGTLTSHDAFDLGFDHIALCMGAGSPTLIPIKNALARGVRQASDFLMALQLTGAHKEDSLANLEVRLPIVVIGGGLTAIDTATEAMAYYPVQVKKFKKRYDELVRMHGVDYVQSTWSMFDHEVAHEFLAHAALFESMTPDVIQNCVRDLGGATVLYRGDLVKAPSYRLNHEEIEKALEEGIFIKTNAIPVEITVDSSGNATGVRVDILGDVQIAPAKTILVAAGTKPNVNLTYDEPFPLTPYGTFQAVDETGASVTPERMAKPGSVYVLMQEHYDQQKPRMSFFGDLHPSFSGNVVKAMASAKRGYPIISRLLETIPSCQNPTFLEQLNVKLTAKVHLVNRLTSTIVEIVVEAPLAAKAFKPGQFYRLQNFETFAPYYHQTRFAMEGIALTGAWVDVDKGLIGLIVLEMGGSSNLCAQLTVGEPIVLMGPTGAPTHIPKNDTVLLIGGGLGNAVLFSIGKAMRANGCRVLYVAGYKKVADRFKVAEIEAAADTIIWCCDEMEMLITRAQDTTIKGNPIEALKAYHAGQLGDYIIALGDVKHVLVIGSDGLMSAVACAMKGGLKDSLHPSCTAIASVNSPMQCMMKGICAQCLQIHIDPETGLETVVYSCVNQDQPLDCVDFWHLKKRLSQNSVHEKLTQRWIEHCLE